ncbi:DUF2460 domain-containing protein [Candidatus Orientia mediorientalis]|uniref:DUF2460 domain-containing protein n=1 Tax=Candidatus Orientia mediorientalis TaxID=911112 RepID=UPI00278C7FDA|nr:DUF2460 domain-containing protein [Candidatus Orientia mediorientalis]
MYNWPYPIQKYTIKNCYLSEEQLNSLNSFFRSRKGKAFSFRLKDHADFAVNRQLINPIFIKDNIFQLIKIYEDECEIAYRKITKPVKESIKIESENNEIVKFEADYNTGIVYFANSLNLTKNLYITYQFDVQVRFDNDSLVYSINSDQTIIISNLELIEVI